jgi:hypothetical protein
MKKLFIIGLLILLPGRFVGVVAQEAGSANALVSVTILPAINVSTISDLEFGFVANGSGITEMDISDQSSARFYITGAGNAEINLNYTSPDMLTNGFEQGVSFFPRLAYSYSPSGGEYFSLDPNSALPVRLDEAADGGSGGVYIVISGSIDVGNAPQGFYSGTFILSAAYN